MLFLKLVLKVWDQWLDFYFLNYFLTQIRHNFYAFTCNLPSPHLEGPSLRVKGPSINSHPPKWAHSLSCLARLLIFHPIIRSSYRNGRGPSKDAVNGLPSHLLPSSTQTQRRLWAWICICRPGASPLSAAAAGCPALLMNGIRVINKANS